MQKVMTDTSGKDCIIRQAYYDEQGFGSIAETHREAKKILNTITYNDVFFVESVSWF